jgi:hypothetical protein
LFFEKPWARDDFSLRRQQKWVLDSLDGISWSKKMRSTQSTAFPGAKKCARLSRRRFPEQKNALDSLDGISWSQKMCSTQSTERHRAETEGKKIISARQKKESYEKFIEIPTSQERTAQCGGVYKLH